MALLLSFNIFCKKSTSTRTDKVLFGNDRPLVREGETKRPVETRCILPTFKCRETMVGVQRKVCRNFDYFTVHWSASIPLHSTHTSLTGYRVKDLLLPRGASVYSETVTPTNFSTLKLSRRTEVNIKLNNGLVLRRFSICCNNFMFKCQITFSKEFSSMSNK